MKREKSFRLAGSCWLITLSILLASTTSQAQNYQAPYTPPLNKRPIRSLPIRDTGVEEKLVQLALQNVSYDAITRLITIAKYKVKQEKNSWFDLLTLSSQFNDQSFKHYSANSSIAYIYPKYFYGITIPIGTIVSKGGQVKAAKEEVKIAEDNQIDLALKLRTDVLSKYKNWRVSNSLVLLERQVADDIHAAFLQMEKRFNDGSVTIEAYSESSRSYSMEMTKLLNYQLQADLQKLEIEQVIGVRLESVIN
ncbi:TolC family protein [Puia sp.]|jgi:outer membrane protein TolC|uniref:TolC family protein n=1 Tax=Puia sp. TaxID=2045100 RepID=UPI002F430211